MQGTSRATGFNESSTGTSFSSGFIFPVQIPAKRWRLPIRLESIISQTFHGDFLVFCPWRITPKNRKFEAEDAITALVPQWFHSSSSTRRCLRRMGGYHRLLRQQKDGLNTHGDYFNALWYFAHIEFNSKKSHTYLCPSPPLNTKLMLRRLSFK